MIFLNKEGGTYLIVNYKVMYSTICRQPRYEVVGWSTLFRTLLIRAIRLDSTLKGAIIVRSPRERLASFFRDKLRKNAVLKPDVTDFQRCQKLFFDAAGVVPSDSSATVSLKLRGLSFRDFVLALPERHERDAHLHPQARALYVPLRIFGKKIGQFRFRWAKTLKVEDLQDMETLRTEYAVDISQRHNSTDGIVAEINWDNECLEIVRSIYAEDFSLFDYA